MKAYVERRRDDRIAEPISETCKVRAVPLRLAPTRGPSTKHIEDYRFGVCA